MRLLLIVVAIFAVSCTKKSNKAKTEPQGHGHEQAKADPGAKEIKYQVQGKDYVGYINNGAKAGEKKPGIIIVHEWWGHNEYARSRADMLAKAGYVAMAIDMYGDGKKADHPEKAKEFSDQVMRTFDMAMKNFDKATRVLQEHPNVDPKKIVAIGYCFGGGIVLNMGRVGQVLDLIASFHGSLDGIKQAGPGDFTGKVLVFNGADDPFVSEDSIKKFRNEMLVAKVDFEIFNFPGAKHSFTNPKADQYGEKFKLPLAYNKEADEKSWARFMKELAKVAAAPENK